MKKNDQRHNKFKLLSCFLTAVFFSVAIYGQTPYKLSTSPDNVMRVLGKSNVHDWVMTADNPVCEAVFVLDGDVPKTLKSLSFSVDAKNLKSEHSSMNDRARKSIKADNFPKIVYKLTSAVVTPVEKEKVGIATTGTLTIAGVSKPINMQVSGEVNTDGTITCTGEAKVNLTDYNIAPPTFMLGAMKVKNDVTIQYKLNLKK